MEFQNQVVIITGGANGIGKGLASAYAEKGAIVVIADVSEEKGQQTVSELKERYGTGLFVQTDVRKEEDVVRLMETAVHTYGRIDVMINNAGVSRWKSPYELTIDEWDDVLNTNLRSVFLCSREAARYMKESGGGAIINIASTRASMSEPNSEAYAATKGGILSLTHALAVSLGEDKITVNAISPGWIETNDYEELRSIDHTQHPSQRVGKPEDIAKACVYLSAKGNDFVTGINLVVDGGMTRKMIYEH